MRLDEAAVAFHEHQEEFCVLMSVIRRQANARRSSSRNSVQGGTGDGRVVLPEISEAELFDL